MYSLEVQFLPNIVAGILDDACIGFPILPMGKVWSAWTSWVFTIRKSIGWNLKITLFLTEEKKIEPNLHEFGFKVQNVEFRGVFLFEDIGIF